MIEAGKEAFAVKKRWIVCLLCLALLLPMLTVTASADCAPKPSTSVDVISNQQIIVTLLAQEEGSGPHWAIGKEEEPEDWWDELTDDEARAWEAFRDYEDPDGFHFWGELDWHGIDWNYYPPEVFKIAVYYPEHDIVVVSRESYERYAFHSDFRVWLDVTDLSQNQIVSMDLRKDFDWMEEVWGFACRVVLTLLAELAVALLFGYRGKGAVKTIVLVNLVTQVGLNVLLSLWYIFDGPFDAMLRLAVAEIVVLTVEGILYSRKLPGKRSKAVLYAIAANLASCALGWWMLD